MPGAAIRKPRRAKGCRALPRVGPVDLRDKRGREPLRRRELVDGQRAGSTPGRLRVSLVEGDEHSHRVVTRHGDHFRLNLNDLDAVGSCGGGDSDVVASHGDASHDEKPVGVRSSTCERVASAAHEQKHRHSLELRIGLVEISVPVSVEVRDTLNDACGINAQDAVFGGAEATDEESCRESR